MARGRELVASGHSYDVQIVRPLGLLADYVRCRPKSALFPMLSAPI